MHKYIAKAHIRWSALALLSLVVLAAKLVADPAGIRSIWRIEILVPGKKAAAPARFISSPRGDWNPFYSPDGRKIVFESARGQNRQNWVSKSDGTGAHQLTFFPRVLGGTPRWSPDGKRIAFDGDDGNIYVINAAGGEATHLTNNRTRDSVPSWSHDGKWVYFGSNRSGRFEVWKCPATAGQAVQVTATGGYLAKESPDGAWLYYLKDRERSALCRMPSQGGPESLMIEAVVHRAFAATARGIYFISGDGTRKADLCYLDLSSRETRLLAALPEPLTNGFALSADEKYILFSKIRPVNSGVTNSKMP